MSINLMRDRGITLDKQRFTWKELNQMPISKLNDDAFTRLRIILMNAIEAEANRFSHGFARVNQSMQAHLAKVRRVEQHQQTMANWLLGSDHSALETTIAYEQLAIELTAAVAIKEPNSYLAQVYRFGLLEDIDHLYRFSALMDRIEGKDANTIVQSYTDIIPGRPTYLEHRHPQDDIRDSYRCREAEAISKFHALTIMSAENQVHDYYMTIGPQFADPTARELYAEIASVEEQHVTQYETLIDTEESIFEKWLLHEANEVYTYYSCVQSEKNSRVKAIWERFLDYELGQLQYVMELFKQIEKRDPAEILPDKIPSPLEFKSHRKFIRSVLESERDFTAINSRIVNSYKENHASKQYREYMNSEGSPSEIVAAGYRWMAGTELAMPEEVIQH
ncbi:MAG: hypothetical protein AB7I27_14745 [Bacteriovoracaceae bacterium]